MLRVLPLACLVFVAPPPAPEPEPAWVASHAAARKLLAEWTQAQRDGDLEAYAKTYAADFEGTRYRGLDERVTLDRAGWLADAEGTFAARTFVDFGVPSLELASDDSVVLVTMTRRTRRGVFDDHGVTAFVIETAGGRPRITHQYDDWTRPGWNDAEVEIHDTWTMGERLEVRVLVGDGDCAASNATLTLEDAAGVTASIPISSGREPAETMRVIEPVDGVYRWADSCDGLRAEWELWEGRQGLQMREVWADDTAAGVYSHRLTSLGPTQVLDLQ